jgi:hypothetical protein
VVDWRVVPVRGWWRDAHPPLATAWEHVMQTMTGGSSDLPEAAPP